MNRPLNCMCLQKMRSVDFASGPCRPACRSRRTRVAESSGGPIRIVRPETALLRPGSDLDIRLIFVTLPSGAERPQRLPKRRRGPPVRDRSFCGARRTVRRLFSPQRHVLSRNSSEKLKNDRHAEKNSRAFPVVVRVAISFCRRAFHVRKKSGKQYRPVQFGEYPAGRFRRGVVQSGKQVGSGTIVFRPFQCAGGIFLQAGSRHERSPRCSRPANLERYGGQLVSARSQANRES